MKVTRGAGMLAAAAMTMSGLAACGNEAEPTESSSTASPIDKGTDSSSETSSPSSPASGSGSPSPSGAAELPEEATQKTKAGAIAYTRLWFEESAKALRTGDTAWLEAHTDTRCTPCNDFLESTQSNSDEGLKADRPPMKIGTPTATERSSKDGYRVSLPMESLQYSLVDDSGDAKETYQGAKYSFVTHTKWDGDKWVLVDWITK